MKLAIVALVVMAVLVGAASAAIEQPPIVNPPEHPHCPDCNPVGTPIGPNTVSQSNSASASDFQTVGGETTVSGLKIVQDEANNAFVFGQNNGVTQTNDQTTVGNGNKQAATNDLLVFGTSNTAISQYTHQESNGISNDQKAKNTGFVIGNYNTLTQNNYAYAPIASTVDDSNGETKITQDQHNMAAIIGSSNVLFQQNWANTEENSGAKKVNQGQTNEAAVLGSYSSVGQYNAANANVAAGTVESDIETEGNVPIAQCQKNLAFVIGTEYTPVLPTCGDFDLRVPKIDVDINMHENSIDSDPLPSIPVVNLPETQVGCTNDC